MISFISFIQGLGELLSQSIKKAGLNGTQQVPKLSEFTLIIEITNIDYELTSIMVK